MGPLLLMLAGCYRLSSQHIFPMYMSMLGFKSYLWFAVRETRPPNFFHEHLQPQVWANSTMLHSLALASVSGALSPQNTWAITNGSSQAGTRVGESLFC